MSHRTVPVYDDGGAARRRYGCLERQAPAGESARPCIFSALENASWADVRRAIAADGSCLRAQKEPPHPRSRPSNALHPVDYALHLAVEWNAVAEHCDRTGVAQAVWSGSVGGTRSLRERLSALQHISVELLSMPNGPPPSSTALHMAIRARLSSLVLAVLEKHADMAFSRIESTGKTPLHVLVAVAGASPATTGPPTMYDLAVQLLKHPRVSAADIDSKGRTPLHDLVQSLCTAPRNGLAPSRMRASLLGVAPMVSLLIRNGAFPCTKDVTGASPLSMAVRTLDYMTLLRAADTVFHNVVSQSARRRKVSAGREEPDGRWRARGDFAVLPDDVISLVVENLSPKDAVAGIGTTCQHLRHLSTREVIWRKSLAMPYTIAFAREYIQNAA